MIDLEKFSRYSRPGPRYTSYPTALEFKESFGEAEFVDALHSQKSERPLSLYLHIPFCRSACYFCGCNVIYTSLDEKKERYLEYLAKEIEILKSHINTQRAVMQLHFGGGTPTFLSAAQLERVILMLKSTFPNFDANAEVSCEIDPRYFDESQVQILTKYGFNRLSFGVQDFEDRVQEAVHREQGFELTKNAIELSRKYGIKSINIDLIYGLPHQSLESFSRTLELVRSLDPDRLAVFNYAHVPWMKKTMRKIDETTLPHPSEKLKILKHTIDYLILEGYKMVGMDHFAKPDDELFLAIAKGQLHRNFQGYTTKGGSDLLGIGLTSISEGEDFYSQNFKEMESYESAIDGGHLPTHRGVRLNEDDKIRKALIMEMMSNFSLNIKRLEERFGIDFKNYFDSELKELSEFVDAELLEMSDEKISANETGAMLIRNIVLPFDVHTKRYKESERRFSKTV